MKKEKQKNIPFHAWPSQKVIEFFDTRPEGLSSQEVEEKLIRFGKNVLERTREFHPFFLFVKQFNNILVYILLIASVISFFVEHYIDVWIILGVVLLNAVIGFILEYRAEKSVEALKNMVSPTAKVLRDNRVTQIDSRDIVPGDVIFLQEGDRVPADGRLLFADDVRTVEGALTGESTPQNKTIERVDEKISLADRASMLYMGTYIVAGEARLVVTATGSHTELGLVAQKMELIEALPSHFKERIRILTLKMGLMAGIGTLVTFLVGYFVAGLDFVNIFLVATATLVSGIPEGLPAILTIILAISALRMARKNAIVRSLPAIETLSIVDTVMTDKTGTLTENTMNIVKIGTCLEEDVEVQGKGWDFSGRFIQSDKGITPLEKHDIRKLIHIAGICTSAKVYPAKQEEKKKTSNEQYEVIGDPTEAALVVLARRAGLEESALRSSEEIVDDLPFRSQRQFRATLVNHKDEKTQYLYAVGAPEKILAHSRFILCEGKVLKMTDDQKKDMLLKVRKWSSQALRVLALSYRENIKERTGAREEDVESMVFVGLVGMMDTPRDGVRDAVLQAQRAGVRIIMTTGDHKETALAIAREVGITSFEKKAYTQQELEKMTDFDFRTAVETVDVFARLTPDMKYRITETLQERGKTVAVTGDGVNDALALKKADIGMAMGITGSDVAKSAGAIILADDNFATIVRAIEEGRIVFNNIQRSGSFLITTNFAEYLTIIGALGLGMPLPLLPTQILWVNLVTDSLPSTALASEASHGRALKSKPMKRKKQILSKDIFVYLLVIALVMASVSLLVFFWFYEQNLNKAYAATFVTLSMTQLFNSLNMRSLHRSVFSIGFFKNKYIIWSFVLSTLLLCLPLYFPPLQKIFSFEALSFGEFFFFSLLASTVLVVGEIYKYVRYGRKKKLKV
jgi:Ca2+-transporting ATPase